MSTSRKEILDLLAKGKISADEAADLLSQAPAATAVAVEKPTAPEPASTPVAKSKNPSWLHVRVRDMASGKNKVTVNVPLGMIKFGLKIGGRFSPEVNDLDWNEIQGMIDDMESGLLVDVEDEEGGEHVQVFVD